MPKVFIDGSEGTTGLRIAQRLSGRQDITLIRAEESLRKDADARREYINASDITILCLPDDAARESVSLAGKSVRIIDASTAHRTQAGWAYGFPELSPAHRSLIESGSRVCVPGCHAGGFAALVYPLVSSGIMSADYPLTCHSVTGYSGGGKGMIAQYQEKDRRSELSSPRQYALSQAHKHLREMKAVCKLSYEPQFSPIVADFYAGMTVSVPVFPRLLNKKITAKELRDFYAQYYAGQPLIDVAEHTHEVFTQGSIAANTLAGRDSMQIFIAGNDDRLTLIARLDNLGKGASGAAVQCLNIMTGTTETAGLVL